MDASALHTPVMLERTLELLAPAIEAAAAAGRTTVVVDGTLGMGGHTEALLAAHPTLVVAGIDRDPDAIRLAGTRLARFGDRFRRRVFTPAELRLAARRAGAGGEAATLAKRWAAKEACSKALGTGLRSYLLSYLST